MVGMNPLCLVLAKSKEPNFLPKDNYQFDVPPEYLESRYQGIAQDLESRFDNQYEKIPVKQIAIPELKIARNLKKSTVFCVFNPRHKEYANELIKIFLDCKDSEELLSTALYCRDQVNPYLFSYAYSVAIAHREDTKNVSLPTAVEINPEIFISKSILCQAREEAYVVPEKLRRPIVIPINNTASKLYPEQLLAYFREDIGVNSHHWHWHIIYPTGGPTEDVYKKDRRGELFYFMHQQIVARYNIERACNGLLYCESLKLGKAIKTGYFPKIEFGAGIANGRIDGMKLDDITRWSDWPAIRIKDLDLWRERIVDGIDRGFLFDREGNQVSLNDDRGIDILGDVVEASQLNVNPGYYGNLHNTGHTVISMIHDPHNYYNADASVMSATSTAMRDPVFYQWHSFINDILTRHKLKRPAYTEEELAFKNIKIDKLEVIMNKKPVDVLETFWQKSDVNLAAGLNFVASAGAMRVAFTHLNHEEFKLKITVNNKGGSCRGTVRVFLLPPQNDKKEEFVLEGSRKLSIEIDRFLVQLQPGINKIIRDSNESTLTIPFESTFPPIIVNEKGVSETYMTRDAETLYCSCGWPHHMLLPKGTLDGYPLDLFVMISNYEQDKVIQNYAGSCSASIVFCGIRDKKYPDKRNMGFPFDRMIPVETFKEFLKDNMIVKRIKVKHFDEIRRHYKAEAPEIVKTKEKKVEEEHKKEE